MQCLGEGFAIGTAFTVHQRASGGGQLRHREVAESLSQAGDIIVIAASDTMGATWGEAHAMRAAARGVAGVLIDGFTRDTTFFAEAALGPVLCRGGSPFKSVGRLETLAIREPVQIMGQTVRHGDIIAMDADGFVAFAPDDADRILGKAAEIAQAEAQRNAELSA